MIKYKAVINDKEVVVALDASDPNQKNKIIYTGEEKAAIELSEWMKQQSGAFGHLIGQTTTPIDLHFVVSQSNEFQFQLIEGEDLIKKYDSQIPSDAVT